MYEEQLKRASDEMDKGDDIESTKSLSKKEVVEQRGRVWGGVCEVWFRFDPG